MADENKMVSDDVNLSKTNKAALSVLLAPTVVGTLVIIFMNKDSYIRFYSIQILLLGGIIAVLQWSLNILGLGEISGLLFILGFGLWLMMIYKSWLGEMFYVPLVGDLTKRLMKSN